MKDAERICAEKSASKLTEFYYYYYHHHHHRRRRRHHHHFILVSLMVLLSELSRINNLLQLFYCLTG